ncbi:MAG: hypothetical protein ACLFSB_14900, partial [Chitinispirillaceae bacterium]
MAIGGVFVSGWRKRCREQKIKLVDSMLQKEKKRQSGQSWVRNLIQFFEGDHYSLDSTHATEPEKRRH